LDESQDLENRFLHDLKKKGTIVIRKGYTFRKRSVDFAPLAWRNYYWVRNRYSTPVTYKPIWDQLEFLRDKRSDYINLKLKKKMKKLKSKRKLSKMILSRI